MYRHITILCSKLRVIIYSVNTAFITSKRFVSVLFQTNLLNCYIAIIYDDVSLY